MTELRWASVSLAGMMELKWAQTWLVEMTGWRRASTLREEK
jgi:hypothetical protein